MANEVSWTVPPDQYMGALYDRVAMQVWQTVYAICLKRAPEIEAWMKVNATWTDRTGNARQTLYTRVIPALMNEIVIVLGHGMWYGRFLELSNAGRYAILAPAVDHFLPIIVQDLQRAGLLVTYT